MKTLDEKAISRVKSMINLLSDEDESIYTTVRENLVETGEGVLQLLEDSLESEDLVLRERAKEVFDTIAGASFKEMWRSFVIKHRGEPDLEEGALLLSRIASPRTETRIYSELLNFYANEFQSRLDPTAAPEEIATTVARFFGTDKGFKGGDVDYFDPSNHFLHKVLESKRGVPIMLSLVYILVLRRLNLPVRGVGLPGHFIIRYDLGGEILLADPYGSGRLLTEKDCEDLLSKMGYHFKIEYLEPVTNKQILERILRNLLLVFERKGDAPKTNTIIQSIDILNLNL